MNFEIYLIEDIKFLKRISLIIFAVIFFILFAFEPFGAITHSFKIIGIIRIFTYAITASALFYILERYLKFHILKYLKKNNYYKILWYFLIILFVTIGIYFCRTFWVGFDSFSLKSFLLVLYRVFIISIIPLAILISLNCFLNTKENKEKAITLISKDKNPEYLKIDAKDILCLKSEENYTAIFFKKENVIKKRLLRGSLSFFLEQCNTFCTQINRAYLVSLYAISKVKTNSQGGIIILNKNSEKLKITRKYVAAFNKKWTEFLTK